MNLVKSCKWLSLSVSALLCSSLSFAVTLQTDANGVLTGAKGVNVSGQYYDVSFEDGTCGGVYPCAGPFTFNTAALAIAASEALDSQVFTGSYDSSGYAKARGCAESISYNCFLFTMYAYEDYVGAQAAVFINYDDSAPQVSIFEDLVGTTILSAVKSTMGKPAETWAIWSVSTAPVVPIPATAWLFGSGVLGLAGVAGRRSRQNVVAG